MKAFRAVSTLITSVTIKKTLAKKPTQGKHLLEPLKSKAEKTKLPFQILEDCRVENPAEVHMVEGDLWHCLEGEAEFILGGKLKDPRHRERADGTENPHELYGSGILGGKKKTLHTGDWLWIPPGEPHQHRAKKTARMIIIKIPKT